MDEASRAIRERLARDWSLPSAGGYSDEDAVNCDTGKFDRRKIRVTCPKCHNTSSPLLSSKTRMFYEGTEWVGCEYKQPCAEFSAKCRKCRSYYRFKVYTPQ
jgi:Zn finger protein HypA/HybF involved in hydrogenase expression